MMRPCTLLCLAFLALVPVTRADDKPAESSARWMAEHYTKYEYRIPMRDGVRLFTRVYLPKDTSQRWPILLTRTPYSLKPYGTDNYDAPEGSLLSFAKDKFILVTQDVRGRYGSEGTFEHVRPFQVEKRTPQQVDESSDAWDTIDWLVKNLPNHNGNVGMFGISYPGFYTSMGMIDTHPALKAVSPQAPITDWFINDDAHRNGALLLVQNFSFFAAIDQKVADPLHESGPGYTFGTADGYDYFLRMGPLANSDAQLLKGRSPFWNTVLAHPNYDAFWQARDIRPHLKNVRCAVLTVGGWYDAEDFPGTLDTYRRTEQQNPGITNVVVIGPWIHGGWSRTPGDRLGDVGFRAKTSEYYLREIELPFFRRYLKGDQSYQPVEATMFETGTNRWRKFDAWPPKAAQPRTLYLGAGGTIGFAAPDAEAGACDEFVSDPAKPVPYTMTRTTRYPKDYPVEDQSFATSRPDVLAYTTGVLEEDLTIAGPIKVTLQVATTGTDADWVVKVIDVYAGDTANPDPNPTGVIYSGYQQLVRADVMRGRFRNSFEHPEAFVPGKVTKVELTMPDICHTFRRGHKLMVHVQSSWFPLIDRNPQTFVDIAKAKPEDYRRQTHRVYRSPEAASRLEVLVLPSP
ncbi:CocE/NonD family hydrolase [Opitutus sp. ER46]|uniref:CocE/NonD family hydrolase n=1 Tax=Opitutus sp. ER46 TaxID=2161864 RepID=UPI000D3197FA|nr:CocE/NonD family hydrolase [Opitutus sp. ER46]PTX91774.1 X-Pro dipeptidyl-peptidase [Opitutus sp. ER46]